MEKIAIGHGRWTTVAGACALAVGSLLGVVALRAAPAGAGATPNTLSAAESKAGWKLLFDGKTTKGWRGFKAESFPAAGWSVKDGVLHLDKHGSEVAVGDIVTSEEFDNYELRLEFRLAEGANSGIKYLVDESLVKKGRAGLGFEYQLIDDDRHPDAKAGKEGNHRCGGLFDLYAPKVKATRPIGQWNEVRLLVEGPRVEHWLNGQKVVEFQRGSEELKTLVSASKYKSIAGFGQASKGRILLQDHGDEIAFRNIKLRKLPATKTAAR
jgi:hypothetical protein